MPTKDEEMGATDEQDTKRCGDCCKMFWKFMFSHVGLCAMVVLYCVAGGFIFEHLEKANELEICYESRKEYLPMQDRTLDNLKKVILENNLDTDAMMIQMKSILQTFRNNSLAIGYDGRDCDGYGNPNGPVYEWSWPGALMFSVTVITTIGKCMDGIMNDMETGMGQSMNGHGLVLLCSVLQLSQQ